MSVQSPDDRFRENVRKLRVGDTHVYHVGDLRAERLESPSLNNIAAMASGLHLLGKVGLRSKRIATNPKALSAYEYSFKVLKPINPIDFDSARKAWLKYLKEE